MLLLADGTTEVLDSEPEMLVGAVGLESLALESVGLVAGSARSDHTAVLPVGSTLLLYTDGLIEHRGRSLDDGIQELRQVLDASSDATVEELLDRVVNQLVGRSPQDDCAILAVRFHPRGWARPAEAGPSRLH